MKQDFIPKRDANLDTWEETFVATLPGVATTLNLTTEQVDGITTQVATHRGLYSAADTAKTAAQSATNAARTSRRTTVDAIRALARLIKAQPTYTTAIGERLGIEGPEHAVHLEDQKPTLTVKLTGGFPEIKFNKGDSDGVKIYSKRGAETGFSFLATDTESPYVDNRAALSAGVSEQRQYQAYYMLGDEQVGQASDVASISVG